MDTNAILSKLKAVAGSAVLESGRFGRGDLFSVWIESSAVSKIVEAIKSDEALRLDWLENLSIAQVGDSYVVSWFLRSTVTPSTLVLRSSFTPPSENARIEVPSLRSLFMNAPSFEDEAAELFGVLFMSPSGSEISHERVYQFDADAHPLRKSFEIRKAKP